MTNVHALPASGFATTNEDVAKLMRELADRIELGEFGRVDTLVSIIEASGKLKRITYGGPCDRARVVGLLSMAIHRASCGDCEE